MFKPVVNNPPSCLFCGAVWSNKNIRVWNVDGSDQCPDGRFESPTYNLKIGCHVCKHEWFKVEEANSEYGESDFNADLVK